VRASSAGEQKQNAQGSGKSARAMLHYVSLQGTSRCRIMLHVEQTRTGWGQELRMGLRLSISASDRPHAGLLHLNLHTRPRSTPRKLATPQPLEKLSSHAAAWLPLSPLLAFRFAVSLACVHHTASFAPLPGLCRGAAQPHLCCSPRNRVPCGKYRSGTETPSCDLEASSFAADHHRSFPSAEFVRDERTVITYYDIRWEDNGALQNTCRR